MYRALITACLLLVTSHALAQPVKWVASVRPIALLMEELSGGLDVEITTLLPKGATPHDYALKPSDLRAIQQADQVVWLGPGSEPYLKKIISKARQSLSWQQLEGIHNLAMRGNMQEDGHDDHHHHGHDHDDETADPHFWFSVENALLLAKALERQLAQQHPDWKPALQKNLSQITQSLRQQQQEIHRLLAVKPQPFMLAHDAYQYLEHDLGVQSTASVVLDPEIKPGVKHIMQLKHMVREQGVACVVTDPMVSSELLMKIDPQGKLTQVSIDPLAWDFEGRAFSVWLSSVYVKMTLCATAAD